MNRKMLVVVIALVMMTLALPVTAHALSKAPATEYYLSSSGQNPKDFKFAFSTEKSLGINDKWDVYSAPALNAVRGANGKASVHTSEGVASSGWHGAWLMIRYVKNNGGYRVGWVPKTAIKSGRVERTHELEFANWSVLLNQDCILTDDPLLESEVLAYASAGEELVYLAYYQYSNGNEYAYVQGELDGNPVCGFVPFDAIEW